MLLSTRLPKVARSLAAAKPADEVGHTSSPAVPYQ